MATIAIKNNYPSIEDVYLHNKDITTQLNKFPNGLREIVLSYLDPDQLDMISNIPEWTAKVNNPVLWSAFNVRNLFSGLRIFDVNSWQGLCDFSSQPLKISNLPKTLPADRNFLVWLTRTIKMSPRQDEVTLLVNCYVSFHHLKICVANPKPGNMPLKIMDFIDPESDQITNSSTTHCRYTVISNNPIHNNAMANYSIHHREFNSPLSIPTIHEALSFQILSNLYTIDPNTNSRPLCTKSTFVNCLEYMQSGRSIFVGQRENNSDIFICTDESFPYDQSSNQIVYGRY